MRTQIATALLIAATCLSVAQEVPPVAGDAVAGKTAFARCSGCHDVSATPRNRMGPYLTGVAGRSAASVEGFTFSRALIAAREEGLVWDASALDQFIAAPHDYVPGTKMPNVSVADETMRANLIAYLVSLSPGYDPETQISSFVPPEANPGAEDFSASVPTVAAPSDETSNLSGEEQ